MKQMRSRSSREARSPWSSRAAAADQATRLGASAGLVFQPHPSQSRDTNHRQRLLELPGVQCLLHLLDAVGSLRKGSIQGGNAVASLGSSLG